MENKKAFYVKLFVSALFAGIVFGLFGYILVKGDISVGGASNILRYSIVGICFVLSVLFIGKSFKKICISLALGCHVVADYFLMLNPTFKNSQLIGLCVFCAAQFFYLLLALSFCKNVGLKVFNLALRLALCLIAYFILPKYFAMGTLEIVAVMYIANSAVTLLTFLFCIKTQWLLFFGFLLFFVCDIFVGLTNGGIEVLHITGSFAEFLTSYDMEFYFYVPSLYLIALSSVWTKKKG